MKPAGQGLKLMEYSTNASITYTVSKKTVKLKRSESQALKPLGYSIYYIGVEVYIFQICQVIYFKMIIFTIKDTKMMIYCDVTTPTWSCDPL